VTACGPWLAAELGAIRPRVVVLMGAVAATAVMGPGFRVTRERGRVLEGPSGLPTVATVHPSSILRGPPQEREAALAAFTSDLAVAAAVIR
jgi:DNA polymerase